MLQMPQVLTDLRAYLGSKEGMLVWIAVTATKYLNIAIVIVGDYRYFQSLAQSAGIVIPVTQSILTYSTESVGLVP